MCEDLRQIIVSCAARYEVCWMRSHPYYQETHTRVCTSRCQVRTGERERERERGVCVCERERERIWLCRAVLYATLLTSPNSHLRYSLKSKGCNPYNTTRLCWNCTLQYGNTRFIQRQLLLDFEASFCISVFLLVSSQI